MHLASAPGGGERGGHAPGAAANDQDLALDRARRFQRACADDGDAGITIDWHAHDVDEFVEKRFASQALQRAIVCGNQSAICGNAITKPSTMICRMR